LLIVPFVLHRDFVIFPANCTATFSPATFNGGVLHF
jgi:hypothetical protein